MIGQAIEWAPFKLREDVPEVTLIEASLRMQVEFLNQQPGFQRRELLKLAPGNFVDLVWWETRAAAEAMMRIAGEHQVCVDYFGLMQFDAPPPGAGAGEGGVTHLIQLATYPGR